MLATIYCNLVTLLGAIGDTNEDDLAKASFPLYNVEFISESSTNNKMQALENTVTFEIHCYNKNTDTSNARFDNDIYLYQLVDNIKQVLNSDPTLGGHCQEYTILNAKTVKLGTAEDIMLSEKVVTLVEYRYAQDRKSPTNVVGS